MEVDLRQKVAALEAEVSALRRREEDRTEFLRGFFNVVSHDLRAPLRVLDGFCRIVHDDYGPKLDDDARKLLMSVCAGSQRLDGMIDGLIRVGRVTNREITIAKIPMQTVVNDAIRIVRSEHEERQVELVVKELPDCMGDVALITEFLIEALRNAAKFTRTSEAARITIEGTFEAADRVRYTIEDNGVGFDPRYGARVFEMFQRLHPPGDFEGYGVGLALAEQIVKRLGGTIAIKGEPNIGATLTFTLPRS